jgi:hypothetical protein
MIMHGRNTFSLWFYIRNNRIDRKGQVPIYMRITVNGVDASISINRKINEKSWDVKRDSVNPREQGQMKSTHTLNHSGGGYLKPTGNLSRKASWLLQMRC